jgi:uncharacterized protein
MSGAIRLHWLLDGEHSFSPRKTSGRTADDNWNEAVTAIAAFVDALK